MSHQRDEAPQFQRQVVVPRSHEWHSAKSDLGFDNVRLTLEKKKDTDCNLLVRREPDSRFRNCTILPPSSKLAISGPGDFSGPSLEPYKTRNEQGERDGAV